ncbi:MAG TPA: hypothetical protein VFT70_00580 [Nocardioides sp.]|nr:hypothetical protein [Nocardioides sp.]
MAEEKQDEGQVSEVSGMKAPGESVSDGDAVSGQPEGESGKVDDGPTGPDAPTFDPDQGRYADKDDVETTG